MDLSKLKNLFLKIMIGCLLSSGLLAVVTVLTGSFNDTFQKSLFTILLVALHALLSFGYIDISEKNEAANDLSFFRNTTFVLIILSFVTSIFGLWGIFDGDIVGKLYATYFVLLFAVLHGEILSKMTGQDRNIDLVVKINYIFMSVVVFLILPVIYISDSTSLGDIYYRILAAAGIIDAILTLLAIILNKLYLQKHPKTDPTVFGNVPLTAAPNTFSDTQTERPKKRMNILVIILVGFLGIQLFASLIFAVIGQKAAKNIQTVDKPDTSQTAQSNNPGTNRRPSYNYEAIFPYEGQNYACKKPIAGQWERLNANSDFYTPQLSQFEFIPNSVYTLNEFCSIE